MRRGGGGSFICERSRGRNEPSGREISGNGNNKPPYPIVVFYSRLLEMQRFSYLAIFNVAYAVISMLDCERL